jgi:phytoene dehydrogenase-like protein
VRHDCIIVGGGHNGLICAAYLARAGHKVLVLEAAATVGGAAVTREFSPGYRVSSAAHLLHLLPRQIADELELGKHGFELAASNLPTTAPGDGPPLCVSSDANAAVSGVSANDAAAYADYMAQMQRFARALRPLLEQPPPRLGSGSPADSWALLRMGWRLRRLGRRDLRELLRVGAMNIYDLLQERFDSPRLQGALAFDAVLGTNLGPRSPGSVLPLLYRVAAESGAGSAGLCQPRGGMGALSGALADSARAAGAEIRTDAAVERLLVARDHVAGVELSTGESIMARTVASSADPRTTLLGLLGAEHLDAGFVRRVSHLRMRGLAAKLHLALDGLPAFAGVPATALGGRLLIAPSMDYLERAFNSSKYDEVSAQPSLEITIPTVNDPALAPNGGHVLSAIVQYAPHAPKTGWDRARQPFIDSAIAAIEACAPGLRSRIRAIELLTPRDIEQQFRIHGGHWHHGELSFDQFFMVRPVPAAAQYATPVPGLFLCGAGAHPGGGVMGLAGRNCARRILAGARAA